VKEEVRRGEGGRYGEGEAKMEGWYDIGKGTYWIKGEDGSGVPGEILRLSERTEVSGHKTIRGWI
jgi:hypothetical protein